MFKKSCALILLMCFAAGMLSSCKIDVNKIASNSSLTESSESSPFYQNEDTDFSETDTDTDVDVNYYDSEPETDSESGGNSSSLDMSNYPIAYVSGAFEVPLIEDLKDDSKYMGNLKCGDIVSIIHNTVTEQTFVYSEMLGKFGYVKKRNLVNYDSEISYGSIYYIKEDYTPVYSDENALTQMKSMNKNEAVTILGKLSTGLWRVEEKTGDVGYISSVLLSEEKIRKSQKTKSEVSSKSESKKTESKKVESQLESKIESQFESKIESKIESQYESEPEVTVKVGAGEAPYDGYTIYIVDVDLGYLALRSKPTEKTSAVIGELYYQEEVYVIDASGEYWYVYSPNSGMYGFVKGNYDYLYPAWSAGDVMEG